MTSPGPLAETALYSPVKALLERRGWSVKGEVGGCDIVGTQDGRLLVAELKLSLTLELVLQAVDRMAAADEVWLAVPATRRGRDRDPRAVRLCRLLGLGLIAVGVGRAVATEVLAEPSPYQPRRKPRRRAVLLAEHAARRGDPTAGGSHRSPVMTAYRQRSLGYAAVLLAGPGRPRDLGTDAGPVLLRNVYGWFVRIERGLYGLTPAGRDALARWPEQVDGAREPGHRAA